MSESDVHEMLLGVDYGERHIGLAFGRNKLTFPISVISGKNDLSAVHEISKFCIQNECRKIIVGLPLTAYGKETKQSIKVRHFVKLLKVYLKLPIAFVNEYDTTNESLKEAINFGVSKNGRKLIDQYSAELILHQYYQQIS